MNAFHKYIILPVGVLMIFPLLVFFIAGRKKEQAFPPMIVLAFGFILTGILYSNNRLLGYSLMGVGVILSIVDMTRKIREKKPK